MLPLRPTCLDGRFRACLAGLVLAAALALAEVAAAGWEDLPPEEPPLPPPVETAPTVEPDSGLTEITITVPPAPEAKKKPTPTPAVKQVDAAPPAPRAAEPERERPRRQTTQAAPNEPEPVARPKPVTKRPVRRAKARAAPAVATRPPPAASRYPAVVRDLNVASGVLSAQYSVPVAELASRDRSAQLFVIALALAGGLLLGVAGAAPRLAWYWPEVFVPVTVATERIVLAGLCLAGAALTLAITWALTGPGA